MNVSDNMINNIIQDYMETTEQKNNKHKIMIELHDILTEWMSIICPENSNNFQLLPFGSYALDLCMKHSDMDLVLVCPSFINKKDHFFGSLFELLQNNDSIQKLIKIEQARVPIIGFMMYGINCDIAICKVFTTMITNDIDLLHEPFTSITKQNMIQIIGYQSSCYIYSFIQQKNIASLFKTCVSFIKIWAMKRNLYSNQHGFLGGISWCIMVLFIIHSFPTIKSPSLIIQRFFEIYSIWNWSIPVMIESISPHLFSSHHISWNKTMRESEDECLKIITPIFPYYNSTTKVKSHHLELLTKELQRACKLKQKWDHMILPIDLSEYCQQILTIQYHGNELYIISLIDCRLLQICSMIHTLCNITCIPCINHIVENDTCKFIIGLDSSITIENIDKIAISFNKIIYSFTKDDTIKITFHI